MSPESNSLQLSLFALEFNLFHTSTIWKKNLHKTKVVRPIAWSEIGLVIRPRSRTTTLRGKKNDDDATPAVGGIHADVAAGVEWLGTDRWRVALHVDRSRRRTAPVAHVHRRRVSVAMTTGVIPQHQQPTPATCRFISVIRPIISSVSTTPTGLIRRTIVPWKTIRFWWLAGGSVHLAGVYKLTCSFVEWSSLEIIHWLNSRWVYCDENAKYCEYNIHSMWC